MNIAAISVGIAVIETLGGLLFVQRNSRQQPKQVKAVLFGLYFWGLVFLQLIVFGLGYYLLNK